MPTKVSEKMEFNFDKFVSDITKREKQISEERKKASEQQRKNMLYVDAYSELWQNKTTWGQK